MKRFCLVLLLGVLGSSLGLAGCQPSTQHSQLTWLPVHIRDSDSSDLKATLLRGAERRIPLSVDRPAQFGLDLALRVDVQPEKSGVTAKILPTTLRPGDDRTVRLTLQVSKTALAGTYTVSVRAIAESGRSLPLELKFEVPAGN